jgi:hypothetical protein
VKSNSVYLTMLKHVTYVFQIQRQITDKLDEVNEHFKAFKIQCETAMRKLTQIAMQRNQASYIIDDVS